MLDYVGGAYHFSGNIASVLLSPFCMEVPKRMRADKIPIIKGFNLLRVREGDERQCGA
jgi:hypothetical protein